jgi:hypothetical protein
MWHRSEGRRCHSSLSFSGARTLHGRLPPGFAVERRRSPRVNILNLFISLVVAAVVTVTVNGEAARLDDPTLANLFRHFAAWPTCGAAEAVGADQARRGAPGYWLDHDRDRDGVACEPSGENPVFLQR